MIILWLFIIGLTLGILAIPLFILVYKSTFKGTAIIIRENSSGYDILIDRFKRKKQGKTGDIVTLDFWKYVKEKTPSPNYKFWHKVSRKGTTSSFDQRKLKKTWGDAIIFVQSADHELTPAVIEKGVIKTLNTDNRQFLARHIVTVNEFVKKSEGKWQQILMVLGPIFMAIAAAVIMWIIFQTQMTENIAAICQQAQQAAPNFINDLAAVGA